MLPWRLPITIVRAGTLLQRSFDPQLLLDAVVDYAIYMLDLDGHVVSWNVGAQRLKQYSSEEIIGHHFSSLYTPEDRAAGVPVQALKIARETGRFHAEGWRVRKDGTRFWAMVVIDAIRDQTGELVGFAKITRDITDRFASHQELARSEGRYRQLVESVVDYAIFQLDLTGHVATWNPGAERIKGYKLSEIVGQHFSTFYTEEDRAAGVPQLALETAAKTGKYEAEGWRIRKDGSKFRAFVVIDRIEDEQGQLIGFAKVTRDVTERYEAQRELKVTQERLAVSQKMEAVGQLSGGIAHDFNNLLMSKCDARRSTGCRSDQSIACILPSPGSGSQADRSEHVYGERSGVSAAFFRRDRSDRGGRSCRALDD